MHRTALTRMGGLLAGLALLFGLTLVVPAAAQAAVERTETYGCAYKSVPSSPDQWRTCDGTWFHANNEVDGRSVRIVAEISYNANTGWRYTGVYYVANLHPSLVKTIEWRCRYANGTTSSARSTTVIGGVYPASYGWGGQKYQPCNGYSTGIQATVIGYDHRCGEEVFRTVVDINSNYSGAGRHFGRQRTCEWR